MPSAADERAVSLIQFILKDSCKGSGYYILQDETISSFDRVDIIKEKTRALNQEAIQDLIENIKNVEKLPKSLSCAGVKIVEKQQIELGFKKKPKKDYPRFLNEGWAGFYEVYPGAKGIREMTLPSFSKDGLYAVIYIRTSCGPTCGRGGFTQYHQINGEWVKELDVRDYQS